MASPRLALHALWAQRHGETRHGAESDFAPPLSRAHLHVADGGFGCFAFSTFERYRYTKCTQITCKASC